MVRRMRARMKFLVVGGALSGLVLTFGGITPAAAAGTWHTAIEMPGLAALNVDAAIHSVSCKSAGNCSAGGSYQDSSSKTQGFVITETNGAWGSAIQVPGLAALNVLGVADVLSLSCASAGNCSAGGYYSDIRGDNQSFVVSQSHGVWGTAIEVPGLATLNVGVQSQVDTVSCGSAGNCSAGGFYTDGSGNSPAFVVSEVSGHWGTAIKVPGLAALSTAGGSVSVLSCRSAGNCTAGGTYHQNATVFGRQAFVVSQVNGHWGTAKGVPGLGALNVGGVVDVNALSCGSAGNCSVGGTYLTNTGNPTHGFVANQVSGTWGKAIQVPGLDALDVGGPNVKVHSLSCGSAGNCTVGGSYVDGSHKIQGFVANETSGHWGTAIEVPGLGALNTFFEGHAEVLSVSCAAAGNCSAGGYYNGSTASPQIGSQGFVVNETNGHWGTAIEVPGLAALNTGDSASVGWVSCVSATSCTAGGSYDVSSTDFRQFVVSES